MQCGSPDSSAQETRTVTAAALSVEHPTLSGLEPGQRAVRELVDRVHVRQN